MLKEFQLDKVFVIHAKTGYEYQEERIIKLFKSFNLPFEFFTEGDPSSFTTELIAKYFCADIHHILSTGVLSCTLNHILCYEQIVKNNYKYTLIFENDPCFLGDFQTEIKKIVTEAKTLNSGFIISLENSTLSFPSFKDIKKGKLLYPASRGRCAGAYIIDLDGAKRVLKDLEKTKCCNVIDWWHNRMIKDGVINVFWAHPPLTEQGSHNGLMKSPLGSGKSLTRRLKWLAQKYYKMYIRFWFQ